MIDAGALLREMRRFDAQRHEWVVFGSTVLLLHGIRERVGDIDLFVTRPLYEAMKRAGWEEQRPHPTDPPLLERDCGAGVPLHAFYAWTDRDPWVDAEETLRLAEVTDGIPCAPLALVAKHKHGALTMLAEQGVEVVGTPWEKHLHDLHALTARGVQWVA